MRKAPSSNWSNLVEIDFICLNSAENTKSINFWSIRSRHTWNNATLLNIRRNYHKRTSKNKRLTVSKKVNCRYIWSHKTEVFKIDSKLALMFSDLLMRMNIIFSLFSKFILIILNSLHVTLCLNHLFQHRDINWNLIAFNTAKKCKWNENQISEKTTPLTTGLLSQFVINEFLPVLLSLIPTFATASGMLNLCEWRNKRKKNNTNQSLDYAWIEIIQPSLFQPALLIETQTE